MGYELAAFIAVVVAATLVAWAVAVGQPRLPVAVTRWRRPPASRTVHVAAMCLVAVAIVGGGVFGVLRWRSQAPLERGAQLLADGNAKEAMQLLVNVVAERPNDARAHFYWVRRTRASASRLPH